MSVSNDKLTPTPVVASQKADEEEYTVEDLGDSTFQISFVVLKSLYGHIIGKGGMTKNRIETQTNTKLTIPGRNDTGNSMITIKGKSRKEICESRRIVERLVKSSSKPSHFVCVPTGTDEIKNAFNQLKDNILSDGYDYIGEDYFINANKIHITFAICTLMENKDKEKAKQILQECSQDYINNKQPIEVTIRGLKKFKDEPLKSVGVLFAGIESPSLQKFADIVLTRYKKAELNFDKYARDTAKLHMTIINRRYSGDQKKFNATEILQKYSDFYFGKFMVTEVHLSEMAATDENGFYKALYKISL